MNSTELIGPRPPSPLRKVLRCRACLLLSDGDTFSVRTVDITRGGISVMSPRALATGDLCSLVFELPVQGALQTLEADVKIIYATPLGSEGVRLGLRFLTTDPLRAQLIDCLH